MATFENRKMEIPTILYTKLNLKCQWWNRFYTCSSDWAEEKEKLSLDWCNCGKTKNCTIV